MLVNFFTQCCASLIDLNEYCPHSNVDVTPTGDKTRIEGLHQIWEFFTHIWQKVIYYTNKCQFFMPLPIAAPGLS